MPTEEAVRVLFIHIPKTGGSSVEIAFEERFGRRMKLKGSIKDFHRERISDMSEPGPPAQVGLAQHFTAQQAKEVLGEERFNGYRRFTVARNPWDRLVSYFTYNQQTGGRKGTEGKSFEEWFWSLDTLYRQYEYIVDPEGNNLVQHILRTERLNEDFPVLMEALGMPDFHIGHHKSSQRSRDYREYYTEEMQERVAKELAPEIALLNCSFNEIEATLRAQAAKEKETQG